MVEKFVDHTGGGEIKGIGTRPAGPAWGGGAGAVHRGGAYTVDGLRRVGEGLVLLALPGIGVVDVTRNTVAGDRFLAPSPRGVIAIAGRAGGSGRNAPVETGVVGVPWLDRGTSRRERFHSDQCWH